MDELAKGLIAYGPWGLVVLLLILIVTNLERVEKAVGFFLGLFSWAGAGIRRRSIRGRIQGDVNTFGRSIDAEVKGLMPYNMRLEFVKEMDRAELLRGEPVVIVRMRDRRDDDRNLVHAMLAFCPVGVIPQARPHLGNSLSLAIDLTLTRKLLNSLQDYSALQYLYDDVVPIMKAESPDLDGFCLTFDYLDERGLLTRAVLREFRDFGASVESHHPQQEHADEAKGFVEYVHTVASRAPGEDMVEPGYRGQYIATAFVLIGIEDRIASEGATPYLRHLRFLRLRGFKRALLAARGRSIDMAERVGYLAEKAGLAKRRTSKEYSAKDATGRRRRHCLIEMEIVPSRPGELPQTPLWEE